MRHLANLATSTLVVRKLADETDRLNDGMYVAHLEGCPFLSAPFGEREVKGSSAAIVIGDFSGEELK